MRISFNYAQTTSDMKKGTVNTDELLTSGRKDQTGFFPSGPHKPGALGGSRLPSHTNSISSMAPEDFQADHGATGEVNLRLSTLNQQEKTPGEQDVGKPENSYFPVSTNDQIRMRENTQRRDSNKSKGSLPADLRESFHLNPKEQERGVQILTTKEQPLLTKKPGAQIKNELLYGLLHDNLINLSEADALRWTVKMFNYLATICEAQGDRETAMHKLANLGVENHIAIPLLYLFQNRNGGVREVKLNRTGAKLFQALRLLWLKLPGTPEEKKLEPSNCRQIHKVFKQLDTKTNFGLRSYIRHVNVTVKEGKLAIQLGKPNSSMGALHKMELEFPQQLVDEIR
jgi:hypothetical protein